MKMKVDINGETKVIIFYLRETDLKSIALMCHKEEHLDHALDWIMHRLRETMFVLQDALGIDYREYRPNVSILDDVAFNAITPDENTGLIIIQGREF